MKALILAGGEGTRLRPLTLAMPKPVVPVVNVPFLRYQLELLHKHGVTEVILSLGYQPKKIEAVLGDGSGIGMKIHYVVEQDPLGTGGAYKNAEALLDGPTIVFNGDILCDLDLTAVLRQHQSHQATATLVLTRVQNPSAYGLVETTDDGRITRFLEKPSADEITCNTINAGTYILEPEVLKVIPSGENYSFERGVFPGSVAQPAARLCLCFRGVLDRHRDTAEVHASSPGHTASAVLPANVSSEPSADNGGYGQRRSEQPVCGRCRDWRSGQSSIVFPG